MNWWFQVLEREGGAGAVADCRGEGGGGFRQVRKGKVGWRLEQEVRHPVPRVKTPPALLIRRPV